MAVCGEQHGSLRVVTSEAVVIERRANAGAVRRANGVSPQAARGAGRALVQRLFAACDVIPIPSVAARVPRLTQLPPFSRRA